MIKRFLLGIAFSLVASGVLGQCNFKSGEFITELKNPEHILSISVEIPNNKKWVKNSFKILSTPRNNIPPNLRSSFSAFINVNYTFGSCTYKGKVKQNGDYKDHIIMEKGSAVRSLKVKMNTGNILNSINFKLLIPETRRDLNEVFGVSILSTLGFITPETFKVNVFVNGVESMMLFQESPRKEMLERNNRREGPIFEGDETLVFKDDGGTFNEYIKNGEGLLYQQLGLARLINPNWFLKGSSSRYITLKSYQKIQKYYLNAIMNSTSEIEYSDLNNLLESYSEYNQTFPRYHFIINALEANHALVRRNRQFYYNSLQNAFEPIYYDGDVFGKFAKGIKHNFKEINEYGAFVTSEKVKQEAFEFFHKRVGLKYKNANKKFNEYWKLFAQNIKSNIPKNDDNNLKNASIVISKNDYTDYLKFAVNHPLTEMFITDLTEISKNKYAAEFFNNESKTLASTQVAKIISRNTFAKKRATYIAPKEPIIDDNIIKHQIFGGEIIRSAGVIMEIDTNNKILSFVQSYPTDWVLITGAYLNNWNLSFDGNFLEYPLTDQRFNRFGMTGCLNIHDTQINGGEIVINSGRCEDSLNIVNSNGHIKYISVSEAYADAIDIDFSSIKIKKIEINKAGNDCLDVSGGDYYVSLANLIDCSDKGFSVGESSSLMATTLNANNAKIGVSIKDSSTVKIEKAIMNNVFICIEVMQKKQEFGGALASISNINCHGPNNIDQHSILLENIQ